MSLPDWLRVAFWFPSLEAGLSPCLMYKAYQGYMMGVNSQHPDISLYLAGDDEGGARTLLGIDMAFGNL